jgi:hypothetical protein
LPCNPQRKIFGGFLRNGGKDAGLREYVSSDHPFLFFMSNSVRAMIIIHIKQNIATRFYWDFLRFFLFSMFETLLPGLRGRPEHRFLSTPIA